jgi:hypothetical protein
LLPFKHFFYYTRYSIPFVSFLQLNYLTLLFLPPHLYSTITSSIFMFFYSFPFFFIFQLFLTLSIFSLFFIYYLSSLSIISPYSSSYQSIFPCTLFIFIYSLFFSTTFIHNLFPPSVS